ncbi:neurotrypsin-like isoform X2 [Actinia tenebrosa]|uniref:Neurotrypsin-like isoform X2 n=1 Tax=Actinia tenebrosa TaxID=6105 RepID=A0A6P8HEE7_ACTTE|nr:neurotrypsin-like isoform X2 [Actinia tenebrosa]
MAKTGFIFLLLLVASFFELATATNTCTWGFYMCASNSQCISSRYRCNGTPQCTNQEDESNCPTRCYGSDFRCSNNNCVPRSYLCNGYNNCGDGSDESTALCGGTAFHVRLVGGRSSNEGRVEVYHPPTRTWGTVCDDGWDTNDATVVCRQLGLPRATQAVSGARFGQGTGPILLDHVQCRGSELTLSRCSSGGWKNHNCGHNEDAGVVCGGMYCAYLKVKNICSLTSVVESIRVGRASTSVLARKSLRNPQVVQYKIETSFDTGKRVNCARWAHLVIVRQKKVRGFGLTKIEYFVMLIEARLFYGQIEPA